MRSEDGYLIQKCLSGEPGAFGILVDKYKAGIYAFAYDKLRNFQDAQEVTQEVFLRAYQNLRGLRRWESFASWLYRIASNQCNRLFQIRAMRPDSEAIEDQDKRILEKPSMDAYRDIQLDASLQEALDSLSELHREVLLMHYFGGMTIKDIAIATGASPGAVGMRLSRARSELREEIITMMDTTFEKQKLRANFTFNVMELVKHIKPPPMPRATGLSWGLSLGTGFIVLSLIIGQYVPINLADTMLGLPHPDQTEMLKAGEIPVEAVEISTMASIPRSQENSFLMAPKLEGGKWEKKTNIPTLRHALGTAVVNDKIYAIGGWNDQVGTVSVVEEYDPINDKWEAKSDMLERRDFFPTSSANGKIYAFGGRIQPGFRLLKSVEEYDPGEDKWTRKKDMPRVIMDHDSCAIGSKIYVVGGWDAAWATAFNTIYEYDTLKDSWEEKANMPTARMNLAACGVNGKVYAIGGIAAWVAGGPNKGLSAMEEYDPANDTWTKKADMPTPRGYFSACVVGSKIYVLGGKDDWTFSSVEIYDTLTDTWTKGVDMIIPKTNFGSNVIDGKIYTVGGAGGANGPLLVPDVEEFDTGFIDAKNLNPMGKFPTTWGDTKQ